MEGTSLTESDPNNFVTTTVEYTDDFRETCTHLDISGPVQTVKYNHTAVIHAIANFPIYVTGNPTACFGLGTTDTIDSYNVFITLEVLP